MCSPPADILSTLCLLNSTCRLTASCLFSCIFLFSAGHKKLKAVFSQLSSVWLKLCWSRLGPNGLLSDPVPPHGPNSWKTRGKGHPFPSQRSTQQGSHPLAQPTPPSWHTKPRSCRGNQFRAPRGWCDGLGGEVGETLARQSLQYKHTSPGRHPVGFWGKAPAEQQLVRALFQTRFSQYFPARSSLAAAYPRQEQPLPKPSPDASQRGAAQQRCARSSEHTHTGLARDLEWFCFKLSPKPRWGEDKKIQTPCS